MADILNTNCSAVASPVPLVQALQPCNFHVACLASCCCCYCCCC